jgi:hypothetical protein
MSEEKNISDENSKKEVTSSSTGKGSVINPSIPLFPEDKQAPAIKELKTIADKPQTKNMEVHHHGHIHEKKKWKEYLFQFLMLFLAVFCGFLAEYQLEHKIERDREKQFIRSLINDITADTARLNSIIRFRNRREERLDSLSFLLNNKPGQTNDIYYHAISVTRRVSLRFVSNDGTLQQLKNAGGLRMIHSRQVTDSITSYDVSIRSLVKQSEAEENLLHQYSEAASKIFDALVFDKMLDKNNNVTRPDDKPQLVPFSPAELHEFNFMLYPVKTINKSSRREENFF